LRILGEPDISALIPAIFNKIDKAKEYDIAQVRALLKYTVIKKNDYGEVEVENLAHFLAEKDEVECLEGLPADLNYICCPRSLISLARYKFSQPLYDFLCVQLKAHDS